ncbi:MAG TPA: acetate/propionate family kinase [Povalibacter sp.]|uniref:acetate/propionate family kinase n=1 Tax=Povalibacter sp. TaxID=1962978 RepID=UPI002CA6B886|nr:acetate/propionate family kinase [Povalibacter sp.]HMN45805.1 acetate/propionate family kinase [Povalibacter sp.]
MRIFALNCGSSSIKSVLIDTDSRQRLLDMHIDSLGSAECRLLIDDERIPLDAGTDAQAGMRRLIQELRSRRRGDQPVQAVAHRIVHGGAKFVRPTLLDDDTLRAIGELNDLAPLHNPMAVAAATLARQELPGVPHVAVFDTAFHATLPRRAREYALPRDIAQRLGIRRYGFHGTSHGQVARSVAAHLEMDLQALRIVSCHLGNGASVAAIEYGRSVETSMGMTPLEGLVMGTRSGDVDPGVLLHLMDHGGYTSETLGQLLNGDSGLKGLAGTNDVRQLEQRAADGDEISRLALTLYAHRVRKYIGAYAAVMGGVDVVAFTGGIGQNSALMRHRILQRLDFLGARFDEDRNRDAQVDAETVVCDISDESSRTRLLVVSANEELEIALQAAALLETADVDRSLRIPIEISARHAHLSQPTIEKLFGAGYRLSPRAELSQPGQFAARESVTLIGPRGRIEKVRLMGPPRDHDQVEISRSDEFILGVDAPVRISGDLRNTPGITLESPAGRTTIASGVICARRHIHMNPHDARRLGVRDHDSVSVRIDSDGRDLVFNDVSVRVSEKFELRLHLDTDEANAAGVRPGDTCELIRSPA